MKNEKNINLEKAEDFINKYQKSKNSNNTTSSKNIITQTNNDDLNNNNNNKINFDGLEFSNSLKCSNCNCIEIDNNNINNKLNINNENEENDKILDITEKDYLLENIKTPNLSKFLNVKK